MATPNSSPVAYLGPAEFLKRYDTRTVGDLCADNGVRVTPSALLSDPNLAAALLDASGLVEAACLVKSRYQPGDLAALTGASQAFLFRLVADLAMGLLIERRPDLKREPPASYSAALAWLDKLSEGVAIFGLVEVQQAGLPEAVQETAQTVYARDLIDVQARRFFGRRVNQSPWFPRP